MAAVSSVDFVKGHRRCVSCCSLLTQSPEADLDLGTGTYRIPFAHLPTYSQAPVSTNSAELLHLLKMTSTS